MTGISATVTGTRDQNGVVQPNASLLDTANSTQSAPLSGNATGKFYGPTAQELGGVYSLTGTSGISRMIGGFGGKRP